MSIEGLGGESGREEAAVGSASRPRPQFDFELFTALAPSARPGLLRNYLLQELSASTGMEASKLDPEANLLDQIDSLMAVEIQNRVEPALRIRVPIAVFFGCKSVGELADALARLVENQQLLASVISPSEAAEVGQLLSEVEGISEEEAKALVEEKKDESV